MPRSKRDRDVSLTKVKKKTREFKNNLIEQIRQSVDNYANIFVYGIENMRGTGFVEIRQEYKKDSRFFFGKNNVMALALGKTEQDEAGKGLHKLSELLKGQRGLMFTNRNTDEVIQFFHDFEADDFARSGQEANEEVVLKQGPLPQFSHSIEPQLRSLGLPTKLEKGVVTLSEDFVVCREGDKLTPEQARILKLLEMKLTTFRVNLVARWSKESGFKEL